MLKTMKPINISNLIATTSHQKIEASRRVLFLNLLVYTIVVRFDFELDLYMLTRTVQNTFYLQILN
ncbi:hypothetical protein IMAU70004_03184 [Lactiplantibacillus plantarum]|nr:hypothetical protein [Lactiplantibacillus plantarum]MCG0740113.1 hypothetical protein [Lactiplantibacillus plantarum]